MRTISFSYYLTEQRNSIKSKIYSAIIITLLLLLVVYYKFEIVVPENPESPPYLSLVEFIPRESIKKYENASGSKGQEGLETKAGGSLGNGDQSHQSEEIADNKVEPVQVEKIPSSLAPTPILTNSEPDVVKLPSPPKINFTTRQNATSTSFQEAKSTPTSSTSTTYTSSEDNDQPGSGGSGIGTGAGQGAGNTNIGATGGLGIGGGGGTGGGESAGTGADEGIGVNQEEIGDLKRARIYSPDLKKLASATQQKVVFLVCINREGEITYQSFNSAKSTTKEIKFVREASELMKQFKFKPNPNATKKECGNVTIESGGVQQRLN